MQVLHLVHINFSATENVYSIGSQIHAKVYSQSCASLWAFKQFGPSEDYISPQSY